MRPSLFRGNSSARCPSRETAGGKKKEPPTEVDGSSQAPRTEILCNDALAAPPIPRLRTFRFIDKAAQCLARNGCCSLRTALASICRTRSRVTEKICPTSSSV